METLLEEENYCYAAACTSTRTEAGVENSGDVNNKLPADPNSGHSLLPFNFSVTGPSGILPTKKRLHWLNSWAISIVSSAFLITLSSKLIPLSPGIFFFSSLEGLDS
ncbi:hypothetical protein SLA2020_217840 [Shorea laevis]